MEDISARFAPLPPSRVFMEAFPSASPPPKVKTRLISVVAGGAETALATTRDDDDFGCEMRWGGERGGRER
jgi:hypothetical protein